MNTLSLNLLMLKDSMYVISLLSAMEAQEILKIYIPEHFENHQHLFGLVCLTPA